MYFFFSPLDLHIYITLKHFRTPAGLKGGFKNRIIAISLIVSHKERTVVLVPTNFLHLLFEWISLGFAWRIKGHCGMPLSDPSRMLITSCTKAVTGVRCATWTHVPHPFKNMLVTRFP